MSTSLIRSGREVRVGMQENTYLIRKRCVSNKHARKIRVFRVAVLLMTAIIFCTLFMPKTAVSAIPERVVTYTVRPGDTLWNYAATITPKNGDISDNVERLMALNHLSSEDLVIGQSINVPLNDAQQLIDRKYYKNGGKMRRENITIFEIETDELSFIENDDVIFSVFYGVFRIMDNKIV